VSVYVNLWFFLALLFVGIFGPVTGLIVGASFGRSDDDD